MSQPDRKQDPLLEHDYDGIREYDNPMPGWWVWIFWVTIAFSVVYLANVIPGVGSGKGRLASYQAEMAKWETRQAAAGAGAPKAAVMDDAGLFALTRDPARVAAGHQLFTEKCAACHQPDGGGNIGPNLTDDYWIHGNAPSQIYTTVDRGVLDKGMPNWGAQLEPRQLQSLVAFVLTLHSTHPATAKEPQGDKLEEWREGTAAR